MNDDLKWFNGNLKGHSPMAEVRKTKFRNIDAEISKTEAF
jgi:hypothetical protein